MSEQAVVEDNASDNQNAETNNAQDDLDSLLSEYEGGQQEKPKSEDLSERVKFLEEQNVREQAETDVNTAVDKICGQLDFDVPKDTIKALLEGKAKDQRLLSAFTSRHDNPKGWDKVVDATAKEFNKLFKGITTDKQTTDSHDALASAVANSKTTSSSEKEVDWSKLSDAEFQKMAASI